MQMHPYREGDLNRVFSCCGYLKKRKKKESIGAPMINVIDHVVDAEDHAQLVASLSN